MIPLAVAGLIVFLGIGVRFFKWHFLIAGYNTMSKERKKQVDIEGLGKLMGNFLIGLGLLIAAAYAAELLGWKGVSSVLMVAILPSTLVLVALAQRYDHSKKVGDNAKSRVAIISIVSIILGVTVLVSGFLILGIMDPDVDVVEDTIVVSGMYRRNIRLSEVVEVSLEEEMPKTLGKINGFNMGYILRGTFRLEGEGVSSIFVHENRSPFVFIRTRERLNIVNFRDSNDTEALYEEIVEAIKGGQ